MQEADIYREKARHCRQLADWIVDEKAIQELRSLANEFEAMAQAIDAQSPEKPQDGSAGCSRSP